MNSIGGFSCDCIPGYTPTPDKTRCRGKERVNHVRLQCVSRVNARAGNVSLVLRMFGSSHSKINVKCLCSFYICSKCCFVRLKRDRPDDLTGSQKRFFFHLI